MGRDEQIQRLEMLLGALRHGGELQFDTRPIVETSPEWVSADSGPHNLKHPLSRLRVVQSRLERAGVKFEPKTGKYIRIAAVREHRELSGEHWSVEQLEAVVEHMKESKSDG